jgi:hypothetical protein
MAAKLEQINLDEDERAELERVASLQKSPSQAGWYAEEVPAALVRGIALGRPPSSPGREHRSNVAMASCWMTRTLEKLRAMLRGTFKSLCGAPRS